MKQSMILLHGLFGQLSNWDGLNQHFKNKFDIHIPELPLFEIKSQKDPLLFLTEFIEKYVKDLGLKNLILVGNSLGGHVAILYTNRNKENVKLLVLTASSGLYENTSFGIFPKRGNYNYIKERVAYTFHDPAIATDKLVDDVFRITNDNVKCLSIVRIAKSAQRNYVADILPEIKIPVILIWGDDDKITPLNIAKDFQRWTAREKISSHHAKGMGTCKSVCSYNSTSKRRTFPSTW